MHPDDRDLPGASLVDIARGVAPRRTVMSQYHATGAATGAFMIRKGPFKYVYYAGMPPQLFDLDADPEETDDLVGRPACEGVVSEMKKKLLEICDPEEVDARAKRRQAELLARNGGREAVIARGDLGFTPAPGFPADFE